MKYPLLHSGVTLDGRIVVTRGDGKLRFIDDGSTPEERAARGTRALLSCGEWIAVPGIDGNPVVGNLPNGDKIRADQAGWAYNDAATLDAICGAGTYERVMPAEEVAILHIAQPLYQGAKR